MMTTSRTWLMGGIRSAGGRSSVGASGRALKPAARLPGPARAALLAPMSLFARWRPRLLALCDELRELTRAALLAAERAGTEGELARAHGQGAGDVTFGLDVPSEERLARWLEETATREPLSLLTEDAGWRHRGPDGRGGVRELPGFDHGGPRIAIDPIDGTRNLMADLRSAWTEVAFAPPGPGQPRLADVSDGIVSEIPGTLAARGRRLFSDEGRCRFELRELAGGALVSQ